VLSRVFSGQARFERHLLIALAGLLIFSLYHEFLQLGAFALSSQAPQSYNYIGTWSLLAAICFLHLRAIDPSRTRPQGRGGSGAAGDRRRDAGPDAIRDTFRE